jgi:hypothetical protein
MGSSLNLAGMRVFTISTKVAVKDFSEDGFGARFELRAFHSSLNYFQAARWV